MILTFASQLSTLFPPLSTPSPAPAEPTIDLTNLMLWWDPGNPAGWVSSPTQKLVNLVSGGSAFDATQTTFASGGTPTAVLDQAGRYITFTNGATNGRLIFKTPSITSGFVPSNQSFTWITWFRANTSLPSTALQIFRLMNFTAPPYRVGFAIGSGSKIFMTNSTPQNNFAGTFVANTWYMLSMSATLGGNTLAYINTTLDSTVTSNLDTSTVSRTIQCGAAGGAANTVFRQGMSAVYLRALTAGELTTIYNTYSPYYV